MTDIRMPRYLDDQLREVARLEAVALAMKLTLQGLSTAVLTLPPEAPDIQVREMIKLYDEQGSAGVFRVTRAEAEPHGLRTLTLEHGLCTLRDGVMPAQAFMKPVRQALQAVLDCQPIPRWTLGTVDVPEEMTLIFSTDYADGLTALQTMLDMLPEGYAPAFDQSGSPWVLHVRRLSDTPDCECRLTRNLQSLRIQQDGSRLCTRVYPFGAETEEGRVSLLPDGGQAFAESPLAQDLGVVSRTWHCSRIFDTATLREVAGLYLERHGQPEITLTAEAWDIFPATGEDFDRFRLGRLCRVALPDIPLCLTGRICVLDKPDVYGQPGRALLTMTNRPRFPREADELNELVRQVTAGKLLGGTVAEIVSENRAEGTYQSPIVHDFTVEDWPDLLDVRIRFTPDAGVRAAEIRIDNSYPPAAVWQGGSFSAMPYLRRDNLGRIARGVHKLVMTPYTPNGSGAISSAVTMTVIQQK